MPFLTQGNTNWKFLLVVVVLAVIVGGVILWCQRTSEQLYLLSETSEPERVAEDETAGWQIYRNRKHGIELRYPLKFVITEIDDELLYEEENYICLNPVKPEEKRGAPYFFCSISLDVSCDSLQQIIDDFKLKTGDFYEETVKINNITAIKMTGRIKNISEPVDEQLKEILVGREKVGVYMSYNNDIYSFNYSDSNGDFKEEFNQVLTTFKFIESEELITCEKWLNLKCDNARNFIEEAEEQIKSLRKIEEEFDLIDDKYSPEGTKKLAEFISMTSNIISLTNKAIELCPKNADFWFRRGNIYFEIREIEGVEESAIRSYQKAYELDPGNSLYRQRVEEITK